MKNVLTTYRIKVHATDGSTWISFFSCHRLQVDTSTRKMLEQYETKFPDKTIEMFLVTRQVG